VGGVLGDAISAVRIELSDRLAALGPATSYLEVGAGCGANLVPLSARVPNAKLAATDISQAAVDYGSGCLRAAGIEAELVQAPAERLPYPDNSFDVVFTCGLLVCIGPDRIGKAMDELVRVARRRLVLLEGGSPRREVTERFPNTKYWRRSYPALVAERYPALNAVSEPIPSELVHGHLDTFVKITL
jgi:ubiquinone/menaquinone biosynthesis C-methylase UbiE